MEAGEKRGSGLDDFHVGCELLTGQVADSPVQGRQLSVVVDGKAEQVGIGGLAVALHSRKEGFCGVRPGGSVWPEDVTGLLYEVLERATRFRHFHGGQSGDSTGEKANEAGLGDRAGGEASTCSMREPSRHKLVVRMKRVVENEEKIQVEEEGHCRLLALFPLETDFFLRWMNCSTYSRSISSSACLMSSSVKWTAWRSAGISRTRNPLTFLSREGFGSLRWMIRSMAALVEAPLALLNRSTICWAWGESVMVVLREVSVWWRALSGLARREALPAGAEDGIPVLMQPL